MRIYCYYPVYKIMRLGYYSLFRDRYYSEEARYGWVQRRPSPQRPPHPARVFKPQLSHSRVYPRFIRWRNINRRK